jgi:hypothetical protein
MLMQTEGSDAPLELSTERCMLMQTEGSDAPLELSIERCMLMLSTPSRDPQRPHDTQAMLANRGFCSITSGFEEQKLL